MCVCPDEGVGPDVDGCGLRVWVWVHLDEGVGPDDERHHAEGVDHRQQEEHLVQDLGFTAEGLARRLDFWGWSELGMFGVWSQLDFLE